ncbi:MAG TPA: proton-conducting transporter membrane subunit [Anaerolineaceae bacterium]|nr:proton-conducting transporter membrane subunit [Anaerolineaceae bacterium]
MNLLTTPTIWIFLPVLFSLLLILVHRLHKLSVWIVCTISLLLAVVAMIFPQNLDLRLFGRNFLFDDTFLILNRALIITGTELKTVAMLYLFSFLWNIAGMRFSVSRWFPTISLTITALWVSALAVEPFLYAALIVELIVLISVVLLTPRGEQAGSGVMRYLVLQTIALPFILLSGWMVTGIESAPSASTLILRGAVLILIGFSLWLAVFPLHTWLPMLADKTHPWVFSFVFLMQQSGLSIFLLKVLDQFAWLRNLNGVFPAMQWVGVLTVLAGGVLASMQTKVNRILAYLILIETGYSVLAIGLISQGGGEALALSFLPRALAYLQYAYTLSSIQQIAPEIDGGFPSLRGLFTRLPFHSMSLIISLLSLLGLPALGLFPARRMLWNSGAGLTLHYTPLLGLAVAGMALFILRLMDTLLTTDPNAPSPTLTAQGEESIWQILVLCFFTLLSLLVGIFPQVFLNPFLGILEPFIHLLPSS